MQKIEGNTLLAEDIRVLVWFMYFYINNRGKTGRQIQPN